MAQPDFQALAKDLTAISVEISRLSNLPVFNQNTTILTQLREMQAENRVLHQSLRLDMQELRSGLRMDMQQLRAYLQQTRAELRAYMQQTRAELRIDMLRIGTEVQNLCAQIEETVKAGTKPRTDAEFVPHHSNFWTWANSIFLCRDDTIKPPLTT